MTIRQVVDATTDKIGPDRAWDLIQGFGEVVIGKGRSALRFEPHPGNKEEILKAAMGRSGSLRAPAVAMGKRIIIGYNDQIYDTLGPPL